MTGQREIVFPRTASELHAALEARTGLRIVLTLTDNRSTLLSVRDRDGIVSVRLQRAFLCAGAEVIAEIARFVEHRKGDTPLLRRFIREEVPRSAGTVRKVTLRSRGGHYDLDEIFDTMNTAHFGGRVAAAITWGVRSVRRSVRRRTLGSYNGRTGVIRINPLLDSAAVPRYYIEYVVYHEMLHADIGINERGGRRAAHTKQFRERERLFPAFDRAIAWERAHIR